IDLEKRIAEGFESMGAEYDTQIAALKESIASLQKEAEKGASPDVEELKKQLSDLETRVSDGFESMSSHYDASIDSLEKKTTESLAKVDTDISDMENRTREGFTGLGSYVEEETKKLQDQ